MIKAFILILSILNSEPDGLCFTSNPARELRNKYEYLVVSETGVFYLNPIVNNYQIETDSIIIEGELLFNRKEYEGAKIYSVRRAKRNLFQALFKKQIYSQKDLLLITQEDGKFSIKIHQDEKILFLPAEGKKEEPVMLEWILCR